MADSDMHLLHSGRRLARHTQTKIAGSSHLSATLAGKTDDGKLALSCSLNCAQNIWAVSASRDCQQYIARPAMGGEFASKHLLVAVVVTNRRKAGRVRVQCEGSERAPFKEEAARQLRRDVLGIGRGSAISCDEKLAAGSQRCIYQVNGGGNGRGKLRKIPRDLKVFVPYPDNPIFLTGWARHVNALLSQPTALLKPLRRNGLRLLAGL